MAQPFNPAKGTLSGEPRSVAKGVMSDVTTWHLEASAANGGLLVFGTGGSGDLQLLWTDRNGKQVGTVADKVPGLQMAKISPQADRIAMQIDTGENDIWVLDLARGVRTRLTFGPVANAFPVWSPDGKWIAYFSKRGEQFEIYRKRADGSGAEEVLAGFDKQPLPRTGHAMGSICSILNLARKAITRLSRCRLRNSESRKLWCSTVPKDIFLRTATGWPTAQVNLEPSKYMCRPLAAAKASGRFRQMAARFRFGAMMAKNSTTGMQLIPSWQWRSRIPVAHCNSAPRRYSSTDGQCWELHPSMMSLPTARDSCSTASRNRSANSSQ